MVRIVVGPLDPDGVGRAGEGAELAADALLEAVLVLVQQVPADVRPFGRRRDLLRPLLGVVLAERLLEHGRHALRDGAHRAPEVPLSGTPLAHGDASGARRETSG